MGQQWLHFAARRRLRGGAADVVGRPLRFRAQGHASRITLGFGQFGNLRLQTKVACSHCACIAAAGHEQRTESGVTFKYTMLSKWNSSDWSDRCPSVVNNSGRLCGVKVFGCISICSTFNARVRFSGDVAAGKRYPRQLITVLDETNVFLRQLRKICGRCTTSARKRCAIDKLPVLAWWHEG